MVSHQPIDSVMFGCHPAIQFGRLRRVEWVLAAIP